MELPTLQRPATTNISKGMETVAARPVNAANSLSTKMPKSNGIKENNTSNLTAVTITSVSPQIPGNEVTSSPEHDVKISTASLNAEVIVNFTPFFFMEMCHFPEFLHVFGYCSWFQTNKENKNTPPRDSPPAMPLSMAVLNMTPLAKKDKRQISTRYNVSSNCELTPLPPLGESKSIVDRDYQA